MASLLKPGVSPVQSKDVVQSLIVPTINRYGVYLGFTGKSEDFLQYRFQSGADYLFEQQSYSYDVRGGFSLFPQKSIEWMTEVGYVSNSDTSDNASGQVELIFAIKYYF